MRGLLATWFRKGRNEHRALSRSARALLDSWPIEEHAKHEILQIARRRGRHAAQWTRRSLAHDRGDLWAIAWLLAPFFLVLPLYATNVTWNPFPSVRSDFMDGLLESIPGILAIALGLILARWWIGIIRPNWLRYAATEAGHPVCLSCSHWNTRRHVGEQCTECGGPLVNPMDTTSAVELPEDLRTIVTTWAIDQQTRHRLVRRYEFARRSRDAAAAPLGGRISRASLLIMNGLVLVCFGLLLFFGNKLETLPWVPSSMHMILDGYGAVISITLLLLFFGGLWLTERFVRLSNRRALASAASRLQLPVCSKCLDWCPDTKDSCPNCHAPTVVHLD